MPLLSANVIVCETALAEKTTEVLSAIRMMSVLTLASENDIAHFFVVTFLTCQPGDFSSHILRIQVTDGSGPLIAEAADYAFSYGYKVDPTGPGGFTLTTEFTVDTRPVRLPVDCLISAFLDGQSVARTPLRLRRG